MVNFRVGPPEALKLYFEFGAKHGEEVRGVEVCFLSMMHNNVRRLHEISRCLLEAGHRRSARRLTFR